MNGITIPTTNYLHLPSTVYPCNVLRVRRLCLEEIPPNTLLRKGNSSWRGGFSLGVDLGMSRTGLALSKGFSIRPLKVLELRGQKLELQLLDIAEQQEVDEFIICLRNLLMERRRRNQTKFAVLLGGLLYMDF